MSSYELSFPKDFDDYEWELESKGWFSDITMKVGDVNYRLNFYDSARLSQDIDDELLAHEAFFEENLIIVKVVNRLHIENAVQYLVESGRYTSLKRTEVK